MGLSIIGRKSRKKEATLTLSLSLFSLTSLFLSPIDKIPAQPHN